MVIIEICVYNIKFSIPDKYVFLRFEVPREIFRQKSRGPLVLGARVGVNLFNFLFLLRLSVPIT